MVCFSHTLRSAMIRHVKHKGSSGGGAHCQDLNMIVVLFKATDDIGVVMTPFGDVVTVILGGQ